MEDLKLWIVIAQIINFWIIFFIFYYFLGSKIVKIIHERRLFLESLTNSEMIAKQKLEKAEQEAQEIITGAKQSALEIQKNAEEIVKKETRNKLEEAEQKAKFIQDSALRDIEKERLSMVNTLKQKVLDISLKMNAKLFDDTSKNKEFLQKEITWIKL